MQHRLCGLWLVWKIIQGKNGKEDKEIMQKMCQIDGITSIPLPPLKRQSFKKTQSSIDSHLIVDGNVAVGQRNA